MYRQGLGDCFLITIRKAGGSSFYIMIDCGVVLGTPRPEEKMRSVVEDIVRTTGGHVDLLVVTHGHWDHVSGFSQVGDLFVVPGDGKPDKGRLSVGAVWMAWTEDPSDSLATKLRKDRAERVKKLAAFVAGMQARGLAPGDEDLVDGVSELLGFFGATGGQAGARDNTTEGAMTFAQSLSAKIRYVRPSDAPIESPDFPAMRIYALGPPRDEAALRKTDSTSEVYRELSGQGAAASFFAAGMDNMTEMAEGTAGAQDQVDRHHPFDQSARRSLAGLSTGALPPFFDRYYSGPSTDPFQPDQSWRRIDADWLGAAAEFALQLDSATNNTSVVLAFELIESGKVLLFVADAQVGNWLSWEKLSWKVGPDRVVTGPDLLKRTVFYKVGHHGSHNATLKAKGLELMRSDEFVAFIPVDHKMAVKKRWGKMPLPGLVAELEKKSKGRLVRVDEDYKVPAGDTGVAANFQRQLTSTPLFHEWEMFFD